MQSDDMPLDPRLAAIVTLLSACALRGTTANKAAALRIHLDAALRDRALTPRLREAIERALAGWEAIDCHGGAISIAFCPSTVPGQSIH